MIFKTFNRFAEEMRRELIEALVTEIQKLSASIRKYGYVFLQLIPEPFGSERLDMSSSTCLKAELLMAEGSTKS